MLRTNWQLPLPKFCWKLSFGAEILTHILTHNLLIRLTFQMNGGCIVANIFQPHHRKNEILKVLMQLEHIAMIPKYPSQVKQVGHGSNYYHTKYWQILKFLATLTSLKIPPKIYMAKIQARCVS